MADNLVIYALLHQPQRLRLPVERLSADASTDDLEGAIFDHTLNRYYFRKVARTCYHPASDLFGELVTRGLHLSLGFSMSFLIQAMRWDPGLVDKLKRLVSSPNVDVVCVEPYHSFIFLIDILKFQERMTWARDEMTRIFGKRPAVAEVTEMFMSREIYHALDKLGFAAALMEGRTTSLGWRSATHLYRTDRKMALFARHKDLSDDVGYRFSQRGWNEYPLRASKWADWIKSTAGDFVFVGWDFETFGEHHRAESGIFEFLRWLPGELDCRGIKTLGVDQAVAQFERSASEISLPVTPTTWAGIDGGPGFFFGNSVQFDIYLLMRHAYNVARLTGDPRLEDIALWLCQSDNLHLLQWWGSKDPSEAEVSAYFTPSYWWSLGAPRVASEMRLAWEQFIAAASARLHGTIGEPMPASAQPVTSIAGSQPRMRQRRR